MQQSPSPEVPSAAPVVTPTPQQPVAPDVQSAAPPAVVVAQPTVLPEGAPPTNALRSPQASSVQRSLLMNLTKKQKLLGLLGALAVMLVVLVTVALFGEDGSSGTTNATSGNVIIAASGKLPSLAAHPSNGAIIGTKGDAFTAAYGKPTESFTNNATYMTTIAGMPLRIFVALDKGSDGADHVTGIHLAPDGKTWNLATAVTIVTGFLPADAVYSHDATTPEDYYYHIYTSKMLVNDLPAEDFIHPNLLPGVVGTFSWYCKQDLSFCYVGPIAP